MERFTERRRAPRARFGGGGERPPIEAELALTATVEILDISLSGVLLADGPWLGVGQEALLKTMIGQDVLQAQVGIRHRGNRLREGTVRPCMGAEFVGLGERGRKLLQRMFGGG